MPALDRNPAPPDHFVDEFVGVQTPLGDFARRYPGEAYIGHDGLYITGTVTSLRWYCLPIQISNVNTSACLRKPSANITSGGSTITYR